VSHSQLRFDSEAFAFDSEELATNLSGYEFEWRLYTPEGD
jgi:hypothetical protein